MSQLSELVTAVELLTQIIVQQTDNIEQLQKRLDKLEKGQEEDQEYFYEMRRRNE